MPTIAKLVVRLSLNDSQYRKGMSNAVKTAKETEQKINQSTGGAGKQAQSRFAGLGQTFQKVGQSLQSSRLVQGIQNFTGSLTKSFPQIGKFGNALSSGLASAASKGVAALGTLAAGAAVAVAAVAAVAVGVVAAGAAIGAGALKLAQAAAPIQGVKSAFEGLTSTVEGGSKAMLASLQEATNGMVTNAELMRQFNLASQLVGTDFAQRLPDAMSSIGKVAASTGQDVGFLMNSLTVGIGRLSPMILDNLGVQVDLNQAYQDFADKNGLVASSLSKTQQQAALMDQVTQKLAENTANIPPIFGSAAQVFGAFKTDLQNIKDEVGMDLLPTFTSLFMSFRKFMPLLSVFGKAFAGTFAGIANVAKGFVKGFASSLGIDMENLGGNMEQWGANIVTQLARGMAKAIGAVISVLNQLGQMIANWLAPGSPPKLLPDLPDWGKNAAEWFLHGFTEADVSMLRDLSGTVESFMRSSMAGESSQSIAKAVLKSRAALESALAGNGDLMGSLPQEVRGYAQALIASQNAADKLTQAQMNLNQVTSLYDTQLAPISDRLKEIQSARDEFTKNQRIDELNQIIADPTADPNAVRFAQLELEEIALKDQQAALEENKQVAVDAAQQKVDAAQAEMDAAQARLQLEQELLQHQIETNNLLAETVDKLTEMGTIASPLAVGGLESIEDKMSGIANNVAPALSSSMSELAESIMKEFDGVAGQAELLGETWGRVADNAVAKWEGVVTWWQTNFGTGGVWPNIMSMASSIFQSQWGPGGTWDGIFANAHTAVELLRDKWNEIWGEEGVWAGIMDMATEILRTQWGEGGTWSGIMDNVKTIITRLQIKWYEKIGEMTTKLQETWDVLQQFSSAIKNFWEWLKDKIFKIDINIPDIPDWAKPGSPIPLHTAWVNFGRFLDQESFEPNMAFDAMQPPLMGNALGVLGAAGGNNTNTTNVPMTNYINNGMDEREFEARVRRVLQKSYRNYKQ